MIPFIDLQSQYAALKTRIDARIQEVLTHGKFIMGPEVGALESALAEFTGAGHAVTCASGTDALQLALMARGVGRGDAVFLPAFTFTATAEVALLLGATPVFVDVDRAGFNIDPAGFAEAVARVKAEGKLRPRTLIAVDLFGLPADYDALAEVAAAEDIEILADAAQSFGGAMGERAVGRLAPITATSFFPAKPLGCYGDGGAVFTDDAEAADAMRSLRAHGKGGEKYDIVRVGLNSRLDTIQAAILLEKLAAFPDELARREAVAQTYNQALGDCVETPVVAPPYRSAWAQYTIKTDRRDDLARHLKEAGVPSAVYYPMPMHLQTAYRDFGHGAGSLPVSEALAGEVLSLPMHPYLRDEDQDRVCAAVRRFFKG